MTLSQINIIGQSRRLRQIIDLLTNDKSRYFAITEFNNYCFIIQSPVYRVYRARDNVIKLVLFFRPKVGELQKKVNKNNYCCDVDA